MRRTEAGRKLGAKLGFVAYIAPFSTRTLFFPVFILISLFPPQAEATLVVRIGAIRELFMTHFSNFCSLRRGEQVD